LTDDPIASSELFGALENYLKKPWNDCVLICCLYESQKFWIGPVPTQCFDVVTEMKDRGAVNPTLESAMAGAMSWLENKEAVLELA